MSYCHAWLLKVNKNTNQSSPVANRTRTRYSKTPLVSHFRSPLELPPDLRCDIIYHQYAHGTSVIPGDREPRPKPVVGKAGPWEAPECSWFQKPQETAVVLEYWSVATTNKKTCEKKKRISWAFKLLSILKICLKQNSGITHGCWSGEKWGHHKFSATKSLWGVGCCVIVWKRSCPAVSQICSFTRFPAIEAPLLHAGVKTLVPRWTSTSWW